MSSSQSPRVKAPTSQDQSSRRPRMTGSMQLVAPLIAGALLLLAWDLIVRIWDLPKLILPSPDDVAQAAWRQRAELTSALMVTLFEVLTAYLVSILGGVGLAIVFGQSKILRAAIYPYAILLKTLPIIAIAPLVVLWIGHGFWGVVAVAGIVSFLPILTNTTEGLLAVPANLQDLMKLYGASRFQRLLKLQLPNSMPFLVAGCKIASVGCVLGAVVGEIFVGVVSSPGLGWVIYEKRDSDVAGMFVAICLSGLLGILLFFATSIIGDRLLLYWRDPTVDHTH